ncbi:MAG: chromosomal replication initiator protein DnaA [Bacteroidales bacterium]|nr:chromosomal replication initiator protein DnaA [Bacteroidales bacterium]
MVPAERVGRAGARNQEEEIGDAMSNETIDAASVDLWNRAKAIFIASLRSDEERSQAERYFTMVTGVSRDENSFKVAVSNAFAADLLRTNYGESLKKSFDLAGGDKDIVLEFTVEAGTRPSIVVPTYVASAPMPQRPAPKASSFISTMPLNEKYTFAEFVKGPSNSWAHAAANGVVEHPGAPGYNPLFIHGGTGLGKTHLMQAIGNELHKRNPMLSICYLTAETFLNEYVNALQNSDFKAFRERYRKIDVLLVDDVQFLQKGKQCQEEFFNTFNALTAEHKQIVMTSDVAPKNLPAIEQRLISRFEGGMVQEIESPSYETRLAILQKKAEGMTPPIPDAAIRFIADHIKSHVRAMEGALAKVRIAISMNPTQLLTDEILSYQMKDLIEKEQTMRKLTVEEIQAVIAKKYSVSIEQILSTERTQSIVTPRQLSMYIARKYTTKSLQEIAKLFDKSHATILHGVKSISKRLDVEDDLRKTLSEIVSEFGLKPTDQVE